MLWNYTLIMEIDGETMETVTDFIFLDSKITADGDCSHEIKRHLLLGLSGLKGVQPPLPFGERTRDCSPGHAGKEGPHNILPPKRYWELPWWLSGKESTCQCRRHSFDPWVGRSLAEGNGRRSGFNTSVGNIPWKRKWRPTPVFLPGKSHGQRSLDS